MTKNFDVPRPRYMRFLNAGVHLALIATYILGFAAVAFIGFLYLFLGVDPIEWSKGVFILGVLLSLVPPLLLVRKAFPKEQKFTVSPQGLTYLTPNGPEFYEWNTLTIFHSPQWGLDSIAFLSAEEKSPKMFRIDLHSQAEEVLAAVAQFRSKETWQSFGKQFLRSRVLIGAGGLISLCAALSLPVKPIVPGCLALLLVPLLFYWSTQFVISCYARIHKKMFIGGGTACLFGLIGIATLGFSPTLLMASYYFDRGEFTKAESVLEESLARSPNQAEAAHWLAWSILTDPERTPERIERAIAWAESAKKIKNRSHIRHTLACAHAAKDGTEPPEGCD